MSFDRKDVGKVLEGRLVDGKGNGKDNEAGGKETPQKSAKRGRLETSPTLNVSLTNPGKVREPATSTPKNVSVLSFLWDEEEGRSVKKPREGSASTPGGDRRGSLNPMMKMSDKIASLIKSADRDLRETRRLVAENPNTKKEIKSLIKSLSSIVSQLCTREVLDNLEGQEEGKRDVVIIEETTDAATQTVWRNGGGNPDSCTAATQTDVNVWQICNDESVVKSKGRTVSVSVGTQTNPRKADKVQTLSFVKSFGDWEAIADLFWEKELLTPVTIKEGGNPLDAKGDAVKLCWVNAREDWRGDLQKRWRDRYPVLMDADGDFEILELTSKLRGGGPSSAQKIIKAIYNGSEEEVWTKLVRVKDELEGRPKLVMSEIPGMPLQRLRKLAAWIFAEGNSEVEIVTSQGKRKSEPQVKSSNQTKPLRNTFALVAEEKGLQYKEVLEKVKPVLKDTALAKRVKGLRSTREGGKLIITLEKDAESLDKMRELLGSTHKEMDVRALGDERRPLKQVFIKGMDALIGKEEVLAAIEEKVGSLTGKQFRLSDLRPNINKTLAITFWVEAPIADTLIGVGQIRVGMANCRVAERINMMRCRRCWGYDHKAKDCTGADLSKACFKCGQEGHEAKSCEREDKCPLCQAKGHRADTGRHRKL